MKDLRVVFMGTPEFAVSILNSLLENTNVVLIVSQPDKPVGRKKVITSSPVKQVAMNAGIPVITPVKIREDYEAIVEAQPDLIVTCAYGQIVPKEVLNIPKYGPINVHASLLPKLRGGAPIHRAIMEGYDRTGVTIMYMDEHMDSGDIISQREVDISLEDNLDTLSKKLQVCGSELLIETIPNIVAGKNDRIRQKDEEVTFGFIITKNDELLDFNRKTREVYDHIRGLNSSPGAYFIMNGKHVKVYNSRMGEYCGLPSIINNVYSDGIGIGTSDGEIIVTEIKLEGKNKMAVKDYLNGVNSESLIGVKLNDRMD